MTDALPARGWTIERVVPLPAGAMVLASSALTLGFSPVVVAAHRVRVPRPIGAMTGAGDRPI
ncbi:DUF2892 domain-containing protein [Rhodococcus sp. NPDC019627]|uniref:DUF2892 domain-containing protein n=1 Tax=unclassified Rhodococcus (in: high G+C Gram-positive bacteria) TaxID=192944 RepID=UPI0033F8395E